MRWIRLGFDAVRLPFALDDNANACLSPVNSPTRGLHGGDREGASASHGWAPHSRIWDPTISHCLKQWIWTRTGLCGACGRRMALPYTILSCMPETTTTTFDCHPFAIRRRTSVERRRIVVVSAREFRAFRKMTYIAPLMKISLSAYRPTSKGRYYGMELFIPIRPKNLRNFKFCGNILRPTSHWQ